MNKLLPLAIVAVLAAGSLAFYPKEAAPTGYLLIMGSGRPGTSSYVPEITVIEPNGRQLIQPLPDIKVGTERNSAAAASALHRAELLKVNSYVAQGWRVAHIAQSTVGVGSTTETIYMLERR